MYKVDETPGSLKCDQFTYPCRKSISTPVKYTKINNHRMLEFMFIRMIKINMMSIYT